MAPLPRCDGFTARLAHAINVLRDGGQTIADIARACGVSPQRLYDWREARAEPRLNNLARLANGLGVTVDWLVGNEKEPA